MTTVSGTFSAVGASSTLALAVRGETISLAISGTYDQSHQLEREMGAPGSGAWVRVSDVFNTASATVAAEYTTVGENERLRLRCTVDTSGTATYSFSDGDKVQSHLRRVDDAGSEVVTQTQATRTFKSDVVHEGTVDSIRVEQMEAAAAPGIRSRTFDDFLGAWVITDGPESARWGSTGGSGAGTQLATTVAAAPGGQITLKSSSADDTHAANMTTFSSIGLEYEAEEGELQMEVRVALDDISEGYLFVGFTDTIHSTVEAPIFMTAGDLDSDAANACGVVYDIDATTDKFYVGGVKANTDTLPTADNAVVPVDNTFVTIRVRVSITGVVTGWVDGTLLGTVSAAVTATTPLCAAVVVGNRSANQVIAYLDYIDVSQDRVTTNVGG